MKKTLIFVAVFGVFAVVPSSKNVLRATSPSNHAKSYSEFSARVSALITGNSQIDSLKNQEKLTELTRAGKMHVVKFAGKASPAQWTTWQREVESKGGVWMRKMERFNSALVYFANNDVQNELKRSSHVARIWQDGIVHTTGSGCTDPEKTMTGGGGGCGFSESVPATEVQWNISRINADKIWSKTTGCAVKVCVVDSGVDVTNTDLANIVKGGRNFVVSEDPNKPYNADDITDELGHGTHVAGIIGAEAYNGGVVGVAPTTEIYASKVFDVSGNAFWSTIMEGIGYCEDIGADVINMSLGGAGFSQDLADVIHSARVNSTPEGAVVVIAAGNEGRAYTYNPNAPRDNVNFPGNLEEVLTVAASDSSDAFAGFSSEGPMVDIIAPGANIYSTLAGKFSQGYGGSRYGNLSGTSMATPHVAGAAALLKSQFPEATGNEIMDALKGAATDLSLPPTRQGAGLLNVQSAYERLDATF